MDDRTIYYIQAAREGNQTREQQGRWSTSLGQVKAMAQLYGETVALFDEFGFRVGTVYSNGEVVF